MTLIQERACACTIVFLVCQYKYKQEFILILRSKYKQEYVSMSKSVRSYWSEKLLIQILWLHHTCLLLQKVTAAAEAHKLLNISTSIAISPLLPLKLCMGTHSPKTCTSLKRQRRQMKHCLAESNSYTCLIQQSSGAVQQGNAAGVLGTCGSCFLTCI